MKTDVLIVGAGPTGLMLACQLAKRNTRVMIIDRNPGPSVQTKALGVQARTLEIYSHLGIAQRAVELGKRATGACMWVNGKRVARVPLGDIGSDLSPYPFLLILGQDDNERLLGAVLQDQGVQVQWDSRLVDLSQTPEGVLAKVARPDGSIVEIAAGWVAGCDGARSTVRDLCNIPFSGAPYQHVFYVADTRAIGSMAPDELNVYLWRGGFHLFFPLRGANHWRVVGIVPPELRSRDTLDFDAVAPFVRKEVGNAQAGTALSFEACSWFSTYHVHHRRAERFRDRRCFLLGDAAHVHSPVGAQGMNTGLQDAYNLAWKMALVTSGQAAESLLDTYEIERIPVAQRLLATTDRAFTFLISERWPAEAFRMRIVQRIIALAMRRERTRQLAFRTISQIGIRYRNSPLSKTQSRSTDGAPKPGDRFPWLQLESSPHTPVRDLFEQLDDTRFNLLLFGQSAPAGASLSRLPKLMTTHVIPDDPVNDQALARASISKPSFFLLRPDGHIGFAGAELDVMALHSYLVEQVKLLSTVAADVPRDEIAAHRRA
ncbi:2-polyprenyl-6-methoxyphenol hydroxylase [Noviherbaspirillum humi]|uniref:2-polyprenyl-6-methoxyphenol hydroxylase n=1 Tax=Noviherbaspirillum humi TaxID=1688639 RepID=A0A239IAK6_9BURK|nr:FAD-dependent monooxygenase [Noviherbaspirillum humi]SNS90432.1 2-polyprenyl-6-methoxyphenol hydroxylase [Noviherbaspirillum humi]